MKREKRERTHLTKISDGQAANLPPSSSYLNDYRYTGTMVPERGLCSISMMHTVGLGWGEQLE